jgi:hypothetical protein
MRAFGAGRCALALCAAAWALAACQAPAASRPADPVAVYRYAGSRQCERGGLDRADVERQLAAAGIISRASRCAMDGKAHAAACGMPDGRLVIADIEAKDLAAARKLGFAPLSDLPQAVATACR